MQISVWEETCQVSKLKVNIYPCLNSCVILSFSWWELSPFSLTTLTREPKARSSLEIHAAEIQYFIFPKITLAIFYTLVLQISSYNFWLMLTVYILSWDAKVLGFLQFWRFCMFYIFTKSEVQCCFRIV